MSLLDELSKHPLPMLRGPEPLLALCSIARAGIITENELRVVVRSMIKDLDPVLLPLRRNQLIDYSANAVRVSPRGDQILNRLGLWSAILRTTLKECALPSTDYAQYLLLLEAYRESARELCQNTLCSLRQWRLFADSVTVTSSPNVASRESREATSALLIRDLTSWLLDPTSRAVWSASKELSEAATSISRVWRSVSEPGVASQLPPTHVRFLRAIVGRSVDCLETSSDRETNESVLPFLICYHRFQAASSPDEWFYHWTNEVKLSDRLQLDPDASYVECVKSALCSPGTAEEDSVSLWHRYLKNWSPAPYVPSEPAQLLSALLGTGDLRGESEEARGQSRLLPSVVRQVRTACDQLLAGHEAAQMAAEHVSRPGAAITAHAGCPVPPVVRGFEAVQEFEHESGLVEGIGYKDGQLVRYTAASRASSPFQCESITVAEALHWWAQLQKDQTADSTAWTREARARFLENVARAVQS